MSKVFVKDELIKHKVNNYGYFKFVRYLPKGANGITRKTAEVLHSTSPDFTFGLVRVYYVTDLEKIK